MSERQGPSTALNDLPEELIGAYSTWKQKGDPTKDSNHHTYLVGADGKKRQISRADFQERYELEQPETEEERPNTYYWSAGTVDLKDPNRTPYSPTEVSVKAPVEKRERRKIMSGMSDIRKKIARAALGAALILGGTATGANGDRPTDGNHAETPTEITTEATPVPPLSADGFEIVSPVASEVVEPIGPTILATAEVTATVSPVDVTDATAATATETATEAVQSTPEAPEQTVVPVSSATPEVTPSPTEQILPSATPSVESLAGDGDIQNESTEPQSPTPVATPEEIQGSVVAPAQPGNGETVQPSQNDTESNVDSAEALMVSVEVAPGDGVTQVLAKVLAEAGYADIAPDRLFEIYEDLVTDPNIGPDGVFEEGIELEYNQEAGQYRILGEGGVNTHLTQAAAERVQSLISDK